MEKKNKVARGEDNLNKFLTNNWSIVVGLLAAIFTAGLTTVHERLDKKIKVINDLEERIVEIEKELQYDKGYSEGKKG